MKKICLVAIGTRGDILPIYSLAKLLEKHYSVTVISSPENRKLFEDNNIEFLELGDDFRKIVSANNLKYFREQMELQFKKHDDVYRKADLIIGAGLFYAGRTIAEHLNKTYYHVFYTPQVLKSALHAPPNNRNPFKNKLLNRLLWMKSFAESDFIFKNMINSQRLDLKLHPIKSVYKYFIEQPNTIIAADGWLKELPDKYDGKISQVNCFYHEHNGLLGEDLINFLKSGSTPIVISFGSSQYAAKNFSDLLKASISGVLECGYRAVVIADIQFEELSNNNNVLFTDYAPHSQLFENTSAVIHHGGIGTTYSALKSGIPQIIVPQMLDQFYWAEVIALKKLGKAVKYTNYNEFEFDLKENIHKLFDTSQIKENAERIKVLLNSSEYKQESLNMLRKTLVDCDIE